MRQILPSAQRVASISTTGTQWAALLRRVTWTLVWPEQFFLSQGMSWWENQKLSHLFWNCWVMSSQYHLIMMSSGIRFAMRLVDGASVWFSLVLAWGAMSWKAIRSIKRSTGMAWAAAVCSGLHRETKREIKVARERGLDRLSQLLPDGVTLWNLAQDTVH